MMDDTPRRDDGIERVLKALTRVAQFFCTLLMVVMTVIISWQIFGRYVLNDTPKWSEQLAGILMVYMTLIGGAIAVREHRHIALTWFRNHWPAGVQQLCRLVVNLAIAAFGVLMLVYGVRMAQLVEAWTIPTLFISRSWNYWAFPVSGVLLLLYALDRIRLRGPDE